MRNDRSAFALLIFAAAGLGACSAIAPQEIAGVTNDPAEVRFVARDAYAMDAIMAGEFEKAIAILEDDSRFAADDPYRLLNLALAYQKTGRADEAAEVYRRVLALKTNPNAALASGNGRPVKDIAHSALASLDGNPPD
ncbi:MAG: hypothetical protein Tsb008_00910 [Rhodothalassiaceae bacterium]